MSRRLTRRELLVGGSATAATTLLAACGEVPPEMRPEGVPVGPFGAESTAEEVTAGLDLTGRTVLVTGATSGLGYESMRVLALRGAHVLATGRTLEKARAACAGIEGRTTPLALELSDFDSVLACAESVRALETPLDVLMCNAGVMELPTLEQVNGIERHFVVNHLGHFLLTWRLLPELRAAPQARIVVLSSGQATRNAPDGGIQFDRLSGEGWYTPQLGYGHSKLANALFVRELPRRLAGLRVTANAVQPGVILTNLGRHMPWWRLTLARLIGWSFMKNVGEGAATQCYVATAPALAAVSGHMFRDCNPVRVGGYTEDDAQAARLWDVSEDLLQAYL